jgi:hypothetical protein
VEASLQKKKKRRWLIFFLLFAGISTAGLIWWKKDGNMINNNQVAAGKYDSQHIAQQIPGNNNTIKEKLNENIVSDTSSNLNTVRSAPPIKIPVENEQSSFSKRPIRKSSKGQYHVKTTHADAGVITGEDKILKNQPSKTKVAVAGNGEEKEEKTELLPMDKEQQPAEKQILATVSSADTLKKQQDIAKNTNPPAAQKTDSSKGKPTVTKKKRQPWQYGASAGFGISKMTGGSRTETSSYAAAVIGGPVTPLGPLLADSLAKPYDKLAFHAALYMQKKIAKGFARESASNGPNGVTGPPITAAA